MGIESMRDACKKRLEDFTKPLAALLLRHGVTPNAVTWMALVLSAVSAVLVLYEATVAAGLLFLLASACDLLDGTLARLGHLESRLGAFLDSTLDRVSEGLLLAAMAAVFARQGLGFAAALCVLVLLTGMLVSYARARAESLGTSCTVGIATRAERVILLVLGLVSGFLVEALALLLVLSAFTVVQRLRHTFHKLAANP